jgi:hypothetical protein
MAKRVAKVTIDQAAFGRLTGTPEAKALLRRCAERALDFQQSAVPVDTGELHSALGIRENSDGTVDIGTVKKKVDYAIPVEEGHRTRAGTWVPAQPYIRPSIDAAKRGLGNG